MEYGGYTAIVKWNKENQCYSGEVMDTWGIVGFGGDTWEEAHQAFREILDWYLEECEKKGHEPRQSNIEAMAHSV